MEEPEQMFTNLVLSADLPIRQHITLTYDLLVSTKEITGRYSNTGIEKGDVGYADNCCTSLVQLLYHLTFDLSVL